MKTGLAGISMTWVVAIAATLVAQQNDVREPVFKMPGQSFSGELPALTRHESKLAKTLQRDTEFLSRNIGERNLYRFRKLREAAAFLKSSLGKAGYQQVERHKYTVRGRRCENLIVELVGSRRPGEIVLIGGHYDSARNTPGANDNASGAAAVLALARAFVEKKPARSLRFAFFVNEEPPHFQTEQMGSLVYARRCKSRRENIVAMLSLETIGYYSDDEGSQKYPPPFSLFYPSTGNFIGFIGNTKSAALVKQVTGAFRKHARFPSEGAAVPGHITGVGWSDHWAFWQTGYEALMVTDTAPFRYPHYHQPTDTPGKLHYDRMARVVAGLEKVIAELAVVD